MIGVQLCLWTGCIEYTASFTESQDSHGQAISRVRKTPFHTPGYIQTYLIYTSTV